jgi:serine/threonine-protein kinase
MAEVYLAEDIRLGPKVAIKKVSQGVVGDRGHRARFEREARAVAHLSHPNILILHEFDEIDGALYFAMEYAGGGSLADVLEANPDGVAVERAVEWGIQAAEGLAAAHAKGALHRDIKPRSVRKLERAQIE